MLCVLTEMMGIVYGHLDRGLTLILMLLAAADVYVGNADAGFAQRAALAHHSGVRWWHFWASRVVALGDCFSGCHHKR